MIKFIVDFQKDIWNWKRIFNNRKELYSVERLPQKDKEFILNIKNHTNNDCIDFIYKKYSSDFRADLFMIAASKEWLKIEKDFVSILEKMTGKNFIFNEDLITAFFTSAPLCPYNIAEKWFMLFPVSDLNYANTLIAHELFHFHFHSHYENYLNGKGVTGENFQLLKESLTILLNEKEFKYVLPIPDKGYEKHKEFREKLKQLWGENKNFDTFIENSIRLLQ